MLFFGQLRELTEVPRATTAVKDNASLADLMEKLGEVYGAAFRNKVESTQGLRILINGREYALLGGMAAPVKEGDTVVLLPPIAGG